MSKIVTTSKKNNDFQKSKKSNMFLMESDFNEKLFSKENLDKNIKELFYQFVINSPIKDHSKISKYSISTNDKGKITRQVSKMIEVEEVDRKNRKSLITSKYQIDLYIKNGKEFYFSYIKMDSFFKCFFTTVRNGFAHGNIRIIKKKKETFILISNFTSDCIKSITLLKYKTLLEILENLNNLNNQRKM